MTRSQLIARIQSLSEADLARIAPYLQADLDAVADLEDVRAEVARGRSIAASEPLLDDEQVVESVRSRLCRDAPKQ